MTVQTGPAEGSLRELAAQSVAIPARAVHVLFRHFPQLLTLVCLGLAGRQAVIWIAVWLSSVSSFAASLVMPLAPLCVMVSLIFCLWLLRPSLPFLAATFPDRDGTSARVRLLSVGGLLVSFLTVYATHGLLKEDLRAFRRAATIDEAMNKGFDADFTRAFVDDTAALIALVAGTIVLRKIVGYFALGEKGLGFTYFAAYLEVLWMTTVSVFLTNSLSNVRDWALTRRSIAPAYRSYVELKDNAAEFWGVFSDVWAWLASKLPALNQFITVPIAWLTLGAVVFGTSLTAQKQKEKQGETQAAAAETPRDASIRGRVKRAATAEAKTAVDNALAPVAGPLKTTWKGLRTLARAGLVPMAIFCLIFMLANGVELGAIELGRAIAGPQDTLESELAASFILVGARAAYLLVVVSLVAAGLDYFLRNTYDSPGVTKTSGSGSTKVT